MASVIVSGARTPMGRLLGNLKDLPATELGGVAIEAALERAGVAPGPGAVRDHGPGAAGRRRADPGPPGRGRGRHPDDHVPALTDQQGLPLRPGRDRAGRPADPGRRVRHRGGRRHGVDDQRPAPAARPARRATSTATCVVKDHMALDGLTDAVGRLLDGRVHRAARRQARHHPRAEQDAFAARSHQRAAAAQKNGALRRGDRAGGDPAAQGRPAGRSPRTRASGRTPPPSRWPSCARRSPRTAPSPPAARRRSPTAPPRSW